MDEVSSELEYAVESFLDRADLSRAAIRAFTETTLRAIKVDFASIDPKRIDAELASVWKRLVGRPLA